MSCMFARGSWIHHDWKWDCHECDFCWPWPAVSLVRCHHLATFPGVTKEEMTTELSQNSAALRYAHLERNLSRTDAVELHRLSKWCSDTGESRFIRTNNTKWNPLRKNFEFGWQVTREQEIQLMISRRLWINHDLDLSLFGLRGTTFGQTILHLQVKKLD